MDGCCSRILFGLLLKKVFILFMHSFSHHRHEYSLYLLLYLPLCRVYVQNANDQDNLDFFFLPKKKLLWVHFSYTRSLFTIIKIPDWNTKLDRQTQTHRKGIKGLRFILLLLVHINAALNIRGHFARFSKFYSIDWYLTRI